MTVFDPADLAVAFPETTETVVPRALGKLRESAVVTDDGRVLYVFREGDAIKQGYASSEETFFVDNSVGSVTTIISGLASHAGSVFRAANGLVYLALSAAYGPDDGIVRIYRSPSNNGGDWVFYSEVHSHNNCGGFDFDTDNWAVGIPYTSPGGTWVIAGPRWYNGLFFCDWWASHTAAWRSTDHGLTWGMTLDVPYYTVGGPYGYGHARNLPLHDGKLWLGVNGNVEGVKNHYSPDLGSTWFGDGDSGIGVVNFVASDGDYLYAMGADDGTVFRSPDGATGWETIRNYALSGGGSGYGSVYQRLDDTYFISCGGRCVAGSAPGATGWVVGAVPLA